MNYIIPREVTKKFDNSEYTLETVFYCKLQKLHSLNVYGDYNNISAIKLATDIFNFEKTFIESNINEYANTYYSKLDELKESIKLFKQLKKYSWYSEFKDILNKIKFRKSRGVYSTITIPNLFERYNAISQQMFYDLNIFFTGIIEASIEFENYKNPKKKSKTKTNNSSGSSSNKSTIFKVGLSSYSNRGMHLSDYIDNYRALGSYYHHSYSADNS